MRYSASPASCNVAQHGRLTASNRLLLRQGSIHTALGSPASSLSCNYLSLPVLVRQLAELFQSLLRAQSPFAGKLLDPSTLVTIQRRRRLIIETREIEYRSALLTRRLHIMGMKDAFPTRCGGVLHLRVSTITNAAAVTAALQCQLACRGCTAPTSLLGPGHCGRSIQKPGVWSDNLLIYHSRDGQHDRHAG
jgi:hypothetical protein